MSKKFIDVNTVRKNFSSNQPLINYPKEKIIALLILLILILIVYLNTGKDKEPVNKSNSETFNTLINQHKFVEAASFYDSLVKNNLNKDGISIEEINRLNKVVNILKEDNTK